MSGSSSCVESVSASHIQSMRYVTCNPALFCQDFEWRTYRLLHANSRQIKSLWDASMPQVHCVGTTRHVDVIFICMIQFSCLCSWNLLEIQSHWRSCLIWPAYTSHPCDTYFLDSLTVDSLAFVSISDVLLFDDSVIYHRVWPVAKSWSTNSSDELFDTDSNDRQGNCFFSFSFSPLKTLGYNLRLRKRTQDIKNGLVKAARSNGSARFHKQPAVISWISHLNNTIYVVE